MNNLQATAGEGILDGPLFATSSRRRGWIRAGVIFLAAVYLAALSPFWWIGHDSALYLTLAGNLISGEGYTLAGLPHTHVPPGFPLMLAGLMKIGAGGFLAMNLLMCAMGLATLVLTYLLLRRMVHPDWAFVMTVVLGLSYEMLQRSGEILSDVPFMLLLTAALLLYYRGLSSSKPAWGTWELASLLLIASCWFRAAGLPLVVGAAIGLVLAGRRKSAIRAAVNAAAILVILAICSFLAWGYLKAHSQPAAGSYAGTVQRVLAARSIPDMLAETMQHFYAASGQISRLLIVQRLPLWLCMILWVVPIAWGMIQRLRRGDFIGPAVVLVYVAGLSAASPIPRTRYFLPIAALLILYLAEGWGWLIGRAARRPAAASGVLLGLMIVLAACNLPLVGRNIYEKHRSDAFASQQGGKWRDHIAAAEYLSRLAPIDGNVLAELPVGYLAGVGCPALSTAVVDHPPGAEGLGELLDRWKIAYVVISSRKPTPLEAALEKLLEPQGPPALTHGDMRLYRVYPAKIEAPAANRPNGLPQSQEPTAQTKTATTKVFSP